MKSKRFAACAFVVLAAFFFATWRTPAQTTTTGDVAGTVTDPSSAVVPDATVALKNPANGVTQESKTNKDGVYRFSLLPPGSYSLSVTATGFETSTRQVDVSLGQVANINFQLVVGATSVTVTVTEAVPLVQTENGNVAATLNNMQIQQMPNPGNDLSYIAQTAPGVVMNTQAGYGNFSAGGMPGNSNLFTLNGMDDNDPYLNLNNSGPTNLLLGQNEVAEATVVSNGYSGQFGGLAGSNINYVTRGGGNDFHGRAIYYWNGSAMNAESFLARNAGIKKPFSNANQWGGDMGGPIKKDKIFWYVNTEGLRVILPQSLDVLTPTPAFESQVINNLTTSGLTASIPFYCNNSLAAPGLPAACAGVKPVSVNIPGQPVSSSGMGMFNLFNAASGFKNAKNIASVGQFDPGTGGALLFTGPGCGNYPGLGTAATAAAAALLPPCALQYHAAPTAFTWEWILSGRIDVNFGQNDRMFLRAQTDQGDQATYTDPINPIWNTHSNQPEWQGQLIETHAFGATAVNQFLISAAWYSAIFRNTNFAGAIAAYPTDLVMGDGTLGTIQTGFAVGGEDRRYPQGRNVTQFQIGDDFSKTMGNHTLKVGGKFRRYDISDHGFHDRQIGELIPLTIDDFAWGGAGQDGAVLGGGGTQLQQRFPARTESAIAYYTVGGYIEDGFRVRPNLTITGALRAEHNSNPICRQLCFAYTVPWDNLVKDPTGVVPYNQTIVPNNERLLPGLTAIQWEPRLSFAWQPFGASKNTVIRGGIGIFYDGFQGSLANTFAINPPNSNRFNVTDFTNGVLSPTETSVPNLFVSTATFNTAFNNGFVTGQSEKQIAAAIKAATITPGNPNGLSFRPPTLASTNAFTNVPQYQKWSLELQQAFGRNTSVSVMYSGNHGIHTLQQNAGVNAFCNAASACGLPSFADLPLVKPDARFTAVNNIQSTGLSNYNAFIVSLKEQWKGGILNFNYAYSKAIDESEGLDPFNFNTNLSIQFQEDPKNLRRNYGPADWSVKHYISANYVWEVPVRRAFRGHGWAALVDGWQVSGTVFYRTGLPYTVIDLLAPPVLSGSLSYGSTVFATSLTTPAAAYTNCTAALGGGIGYPNTCLKSSSFLPASTETQFGNLGRNSFVGPHFFDTDFTLMKQTKIPHWERGQLGIGLQFFNLFNHPNFDQPVQDVANGSFGRTVAQVASPTSILGSFLGGDNSPRLIQLKAQFSF